MNALGAMEVMAAIWGLSLRPREKLYLLGFASSSDPEYLRTFACLSPREAESVRYNLRRDGWIDEHGELVLARATRR